MKKIVVLGNWKANKNLDEARSWISSFQTQVPEIPASVSVILCPGLPELPLVKAANLPVELGAQDISAFAGGAYTGEVTGAMFGGLVRYVLIGHSERRGHLKETDDIVAKKVTMAMTASLVPIVCASQVEQVIYIQKTVPTFASVGMILYEPLFAVGTGIPDTPQHANDQARAMQHAVSHPIAVLYGGSVNAQNIRSFVSQLNVSGVAVGTGSLDPSSFAHLITMAASV